MATTRTKSQPKPLADTPEIPEGSILRQTTPYLDEQEIYADYRGDSFNVLDVDRRVALLSRFIIEAALRSRQIDLRAKADIALRAIQVLEGQKVRSEIWHKDDKTHVPKDAAIYAKERAEIEAKLRGLLVRQAERKVLTAQSEVKMAEAALEAADKDTSHDGK